MAAETIIFALKKHYGIKPRNWHTRQSPFKRKRGLRDMQNPIDSAFRVLISTVLSQRTRDENTDKAAQQLFAKYSNPRQLSEASTKDMQKLIKSAGFYRQKALRIRDISRILAEKHHGMTPKKLDELLELPGVGRKTANCVLVYGHGIPAIPVDTHVHRISNRIGIVKTEKPEQTEFALMKVAPKKHWLLLNQLFVIHGQNICRPASPKCGICPVNKYCSYFNNVYGISDRRLRKRAEHRDRQENIRRARGGRTMGNCQEVRQGRVLGHQDRGQHRLHTHHS